jgi:hypothetical protein
VLRTENFWAKILADLDLLARFKPTIKRAVYSTLFGMRERNIRRNLVKGSTGEPGLGEARADALLSHPLIREILQARDREHQIAKEDGFVLDAFGNRITLSAGVDSKQALAQQIQSYEVRIMRVVAPILQEEEDSVKLIDWLHDGIVLWFHTHHQEKQNRILDEIAEAITAEARALGIDLDVEREPVPDQAETLLHIG